MRIISGEAKGRKLFAPNGDDTRPTSDKIRGSLFNIIGADIRESNVLDLFGGTGAMALEALSRGANYAVICDSSRMAYECIERNARNVLADGFTSRIRLFKSDYKQAIERLPGIKFDYVFLDPPYRMTEAYAYSMTRLKQIGVLNRQCVIVAERNASYNINYPSDFRVFDTRTYGDTAVDFIAEVEPE